MSRLLVDTASRFLARRSPRRGFLAKTAVVGSALAVAPMDFLTKPASAYSRVCRCNGSTCSCGSLCCDGYTEFCCTVFGTNGCPAGSLYGGWWRVSGSNFCGGANRYYMDCHSQCKGCACGAGGVCSGSCTGTACGCALGSCRNRKAGCTHFRYGQCNRNVKCLGPIICRVVTCTPPWQLEPNCSTSSRTDENTRNHNRACLSELSPPPVGELDVVDGQPGTIRIRGWAIDPDNGGTTDVLIFINGNLVQSVAADQPRPDVGAAYRGFGDEHGFDVSLFSTNGTKEVCVYAVNAGGGQNPLLGCKTVRVSSTKATGILERVSSTGDGVAVSGWALMPGRRRAMTVDLYVDNVHAATIKANQKRSDLATTFGDSGDEHGFATTLATTPGQSLVCARVTDPKTGDIIDLGCVTTRAASPTIAAEGAIDKIKGRTGKIRVVGWALDPNGGTMEVVVTVGGVEAVRAAADLPRPDVASLYPAADSTGGFKILVPAEAGKHTVCVYTVSSDGVDGPMLGCADTRVD
ncbi:MAG: twin-arginine translocation signal domain-containing protein [Acidimicrobiales bacterium]